MRNHVLHHKDCVRPELAGCSTAST